MHYAVIHCYIPDHFWYYCFGPDATWHGTACFGAEMQLMVSIGAIISNINLFSGSALVGRLQV